MKTLFLLSSATLVSLSTLACGSSSAADSSGGSAGAPGTGGSSGSSASALVEKLSKCPPLSVSSDPDASACLLGTYSGKTLSGEDCSLVLEAEGAYTFTSPKLTVDHVAPAETIYVYGYTKVQETNLLSWKVNDPLNAELYYELSFTAKFGSQIPESDRKIQIDVTEEAGTKTSVSCLVEL